MAVPGWPLPTFCTASAASTRTVSTARTSRSVQLRLPRHGPGDVRARVPGSRVARAPARGCRAHWGLSRGRSCTRWARVQPSDPSVWHVPRRSGLGQRRGKARIADAPRPAAPRRTTWPPPRSTTDRRRSSGSTDAARSANYLALTKPRIIELLLVTTVPVMFLAERGVPSLWLVARDARRRHAERRRGQHLQLVYDRDIDRLMHRTSNRPMVTGEITPAQRARLRRGAHRRRRRSGSPWSSTGCRAALSVAAILLYAVGYTMLLKRRTVAEHRLGRRWPAACPCSSAGRPSPAPCSGRPSSSSSSSSSGRRRTTGRCRCASATTTPPPACRCCPSSRGRSSSAARSSSTRGRWCDLAGARAGGRRWAGSTPSPRCWPAGCSSLEAHRLLRAAKGGATGPALKPMRLFHFSITYVTVLFLAVAVDPLLHVAIG